MNSQSRFAFIVGAPRCGTTTLAGFLQQHPDVCFSAVKEPHFFTQYDLSGRPDGEVRATVETEYLERFFGDCPDDAQLRAEGSVTYLYMPERMEPILKLWPDARFIIALRDPLAMLPSLHARLLVTGDETIRDFRDAWAMVPERRAGRSIPKSAMDPRWLRYDEAGRHGQHVERFFEAVGPERCHIVLFDDLSNDPEQAYRELCAFLGLDPWAETDFRPRRVNNMARIGWLQRFLKRPPKAVRTVLAGEKFRQREKRLDQPDSPLVSAIFAVRRRLLAWNKVPATREPLDPTVRAEIIASLRDDVIHLAHVIGRDLSHWLGGVPEARPDPAERTLAGRAASIG